MRARASRLVVGLAVVALVAGLVPAGRPANAQPERLRPHVDMQGDVLAFADPSVLVVGDTAYAYGTNSIVPSINLQLSTSTDLHTWTPAREVMPETPPWAWPMAEGGEFWAPTIVRLGDRYLLYYAAHHRLAPAREPGWCIGYAEARSPAGPFTPGTVPLICSVVGEEPLSPLGPLLPIRGAGVIDPQVFEAPDGRRFLYFKADDNRFQLWGVPLGGNGISVGEVAFGLVDLPPTSLTWERTAEARPVTVLENPAMVHHPAGGDTPYTLFYSGNDFRTSDYATGLARCEGPLGPCTRVTTDAGWMVSRGGVGGPGGASVFTGFDGQPWLAYHAWRRGEPTWVGRRLHVEPLGLSRAEPELLRRPTTGTFEVVSEPGQVTIRGVAEDPDTGEPLAVSVREQARELDVVAVGADGGFSATFPAAEGDRTYCARVLPVDDGPGRNLYCQTVSVPPPPIVAVAPEAPPGVAP